MTTCSPSPLLVRSESEEKQFGIRIFRGDAEELDIERLSQEIIGNSIDLTILHVSSDSLPLIHLLDNTGFPYTIVDTIVVHHADLERYIPKELNNKDLVFVQAADGNAGTLDRLVEETFTDYASRYYSNPFVPNSNRLRGYKELARSHIAGANKSAWFIKRREEIIAFVVLSVAGEEGEPVLGGVLQKSSGGGVYTDFIRFSQKFFRDKGLKRIKVASQLQNHAVQKVWSREGFSPATSYVTIHINSLLDTSMREKRTYSLESLHKDRSLDQGASMHSIISEVACHECFESGATIRFYMYRIFKSINPGCGQNVTISYPYMSPGGSESRLVIKVSGKDGDLCAIGYLDMIHSDAH